MQVAKNIWIVWVMIRLFYDSVVCVSLGSVFCKCFLLKNKVAHKTKILWDGENRHRINYFLGLYFIFGLPSSEISALYGATLTSELIINK